MLNPFKTDELLKRGRQFTVINGVFLVNLVGVAANVPWTQVNVAGQIPAWTRGILIRMHLTPTVVGAGAVSYARVRRDAAYGNVHRLLLTAAGAAAGWGRGENFMMPITDAQTYDYEILCGAGWTLNFYMWMYAYS